MLRRTLIASAAAVAFVGCASDKGPDSTAVPANLEVVVIDAQSPFADTGSPYLQALEREVPLKGTGVRAITLPPYGRDGGSLVEDAVVFAAQDRTQLEHFFDELPARWSLPASHELRYGKGTWPEGTGPPQWGAHVIRVAPAIRATNVIGVEDGPDGVSIHLDSDGTTSLADLTAQNVGQRLALIVDNEIVADPVVNERIADGRLRITLGDGAPAHRALALRLATSRPS